MLNMNIPNFINPHSIILRLFPSKKARIKIEIQDIKFDCIFKFIFIGYTVIIMCINVFRYRILMVGLNVSKSLNWILSINWYCPFHVQLVNDTSTITTTISNSYDEKYFFSSHLWYTFQVFDGNFRLNAIRSEVNLNLI